MGRAFSYAEMDESFFDEASELLDTASSLLVKAEKANNIAPVIPEVFRSFHTIKGGAQMVGCDLLANFAHQMEDLLDQVRLGHVPANLEVAGLVIDAIALMEEEVSCYRQGQHPDDYSARQTEILELVRKLCLQHVDFSAAVSPSPVSNLPDVTITKDVPTSSVGKRLFFICFKIDESAPMPDITEILLRQRLQENGDIVYSESTNSDGLGLTAILLTDLEAMQLHKACDSADVLEIHIQELSLNAFAHCHLPFPAIDTFLQLIADADFLINNPSQSKKKIFEIFVDLSAWGEQYVVSSGCFPCGRTEWDRSLTLLKTGISLFNQPHTNPEQLHLLEQLLQNLWECVYSRLENKVYFFSVSPGSGCDISGLLQTVKGIVKGAPAKSMMLDVSAVSVLEGEAVSIILETISWLKGRGILPFIVAKGDYRHRHQNALEALSSSVDGLKIYSSTYQAFFSENHKSLGF